MKSIKSDEILTVLRDFNRENEERGIRLIGLFGSYARDEASDFSDIDIAYRIDHHRFYPDNAFRKLEALQEIRSELERRFRRRVDLVPYPQKGHPLYQRLATELLSA
jgi:predicted nucleotidyltransferase